MRRLAASVTALFAFCVTSALAQQQAGTGKNNAVQDAARYWQTPGDTDHDSKGNVTYTEIRDAKTFTTKVFIHGQWLTYHYRPNSTEIVSVDTADSTDAFLYDGAGKWNGLAVTAAGKSHRLRYDTGRGVISTDGMPDVTIEKDPGSVATRDLLVRRGTEIVASVIYAQSGNVQSLNVGAMTLSFALVDGHVKETLQANGATLKVTTTTGEGRRFFNIILDPVADRLGIGKDWANQTQSTTTATGFMTSVNQGKATLARVVQFGGMRVAFDINGEPLFYDIDFDYGSGYAGGDHQRNFKVTGAYTGVLPTRIIITADGDVGAYVQHPGDSAIRAFWTTTSKGKTTYSYSVYDSGTAKHGTALGVMKPSSLSSQARDTPTLTGSHGVSPQLMMICDATYVCSSSNGCNGCGGCTTTYYYCDTGGGGYTTPPDDSGGGGGGGSPGNQVIDVTTRQAVDRAIQTANQKFGSAQCSQNLLNDLTMPDGTQMSTILQQKGTTAAGWFGTVGWYFGDGAKDSNNQVPCNTAAAWTSPNTVKVYVCSSFKNLRSPSVQADTLIHEMLHTLGLPECNTYTTGPCPTGYLTAGQIEQSVEDHCGG